MSTGSISYHILKEHEDLLLPFFQMEGRIYFPGDSMRFWLILSIVFIIIVLGVVPYTSFFAFLKIC